jgi:hypothetical protein
MNSLPTGTVTFFCTDIGGNTNTDYAEFNHLSELAHYRLHQILRKFCYLSQVQSKIQELQQLMKIPVFGSNRIHEVFISIMAFCR